MIITAEYWSAYKKVEENLKDQPRTIKDFSRHEVHTMVYEQMAKDRKEMDAALAALSRARAAQVAALSDCVSTLHEIKRDVQEVSDAVRGVHSRMFAAAPASSATAVAEEEPAECAAAEDQSKISGSMRCGK